MRKPEPRFVPEPAPRSDEPMIPAPKIMREPVECDCAAGLRRIEAKVDGLIASIVEYQTHLGDVHGTVIGDGLSQQMKIDGVHAAVEAVAANQANLVEAVSDLVNAQGEVAGELFGIADGLAAAADEDDGDQGERGD
jgi:hypothetical protein